MTDIDDWVGHNIPEVVLDDAAKWLARLDAEDCNAADRLAFARWLAEDPCHQWAFEELSEIWARLHTLADVRPLQKESRVIQLSERRPQALVSAQPAKPQSDWTALAASVLVLLGVLVHFIAATPAERIETRAGETRMAMLDDGTRVEINAQTRIAVRINDEQRRVSLDEGDAVFHVASNERPFVVRTARGSVTALGTSFAVLSAPGRLQVSVLEGRVRVRVNEELQALTEFDGATASAPGANVTELAAGEQLLISGDRRQQQMLAADALEQALSWRLGYLRFEQQPLTDILAEMRRYLDTNIHLADPALGALRLSGEFRTNDAGDFLRQLAEHPAIHVDQSDPRWVILRPTALIASH
jgi:transmembrane sensor